jgi:hypothetical protein
MSLAQKASVQPKLSDIQDASTMQRFIILSDRTLSKKERKCIEGVGTLIQLDAKTQNYKYAELVAESKLDFLFITVAADTIEWIGLNLKEMAEDYKVILTRDRDAKFVDQVKADNLIKSLPEFALTKDEFVSSLMKAEISRPKHWVEKALKALFACLVA